MVNFLLHQNRRTSAAIPPVTVTGTLWDGLTVGCDAVGI